MCSVDVPMYFGRWQAQLADGTHYPGLFAGLHDLATDWVAAHSLEQRALTPGIDDRQSVANQIVFSKLIRVRFALFGRPFFARPSLHGLLCTVGDDTHDHHSGHHERW
ncbi:MAG: hypothetical protein WBB34_04380 [Xanthobacteraceae bacterium]